MRFDVVLNIVAGEVTLLGVRLHFETFNVFCFVAVGIDSHHEESHLDSGAFNVLLDLFPEQLVVVELLPLRILLQAQRVISFRDLLGLLNLGVLFLLDLVFGSELGLHDEFIFPELVDLFFLT